MTVKQHDVIAINTIVYQDVRGMAGDWDNADAGNEYLNIAYDLESMGLEVATIRDILQRCYHAVALECGAIKE